MSSSLPIDLVERIQTFLASGSFTSEEDVLRAALAALEKTQMDAAAIAAGIADMEAGRYRPFAEVDTDFRNRHAIPNDGR